MTIPLVDMHCHLFAGLDDGPTSDDQAVEMCRILAEQGVCSVAAVAHQNDFWPNTAEEIRAAGRRLQSSIQSAGVSLDVFPSGEIMLQPDVLGAWEQGELLSIGDGGRYLLIELPPGVFLDFRPLALHFRNLGVRPILAHAERTSQLLYDWRAGEELIAAGCLIQVNAGNIVHPTTREQGRAVREWVEGGMVHFVGSDGHGPERRPPFIAEAYKRIVSWTDAATAERICRKNGLAALAGEPMEAPPPVRPERRWFSLWRR